ncbi:MAG: aminotransferase class IV [Ferrimicrobium sp.]
MAVAWVDGEIVEESEAVISIFDHGLIVGDGGFETIAVINQKPFALTRHLARLRRTARGLGLPDPPVAAITHGIAALISSNGYQFAKLRVTYTGGESELGSVRRGDPPHTIVAEQPVSFEPVTCRLAVAPWPRNERSVLAGLKTTSYAENVLGLRWAMERGASEVIFGNTVGNLCEGSGANIFVVRDGEILTPPLGAGPLAGVTRDLVIEGVGVKEVDLPLSELMSDRVSEVFVTSTLRMVQGVEMIDDRVFSPAPGPLTIEAQRYFSELIATQIDP